MEMYCGFFHPFLQCMIIKWNSPVSLESCYVHALHVVTFSTAHAVRVVNSWHVDSLRNERFPVIAVLSKIRLCVQS